MTKFCDINGNGIIDIGDAQYIAAFLAGLQIGIFKSLNHISRKWKLNKKYVPKINSNKRLYLLKGWSKSVRKTLLN